MLDVMSRLCTKFTRLFAVKQPTITKGIVIALFLSVASLLCLAIYVSTFNNNLTRLPPEPTISCGTEASGLRGKRQHAPRDHTSSASLRIDNKVLVLIETQYSKQGVEIVSILEANRIRYKLELAQKRLPSLTRMDKGKYGVIVFENFESYLNMENWNRQLLDKYCSEYNVGVIAFTYPTEETLVQAKVKGFPLYVHTNLAMKDFEINSHSDVLRVTRSGETLSGSLPGDDWVVFVPNHTTYEPLAFAKTQSAEMVSMSYSVEESNYVTAIQDIGLLDGIQRVYFGNDFKFWLHIPLFLDSLSYLSHGKFSIPLDRHILIDIDDIFVGKSGIRMKADDVVALIDAQSRLQNSIKGFHFNLGFSGKFFHGGTVDENKGDDLLLENSDLFWWFPHTWRHLQPHKFDNTSSLVSEMRLNYRFAQEHGIPVNGSYAVAPHHSGVFPVHEPLYDAWRRVWGIRVTSTEEYPHLRPARRRRGYTYKNIMVLPRQTCGLFTHTILFDKFPGGSERLESSIRGGELFQTVLFNPVMVFMTHMSNYGNDRLGLYTFESVVKFVQCWTNLQLKSLPPLDLARLYFKMYPDEKDPVWRNPCDDKRHLEIWSEQKTCNRLPHFLVIGPQKTGTTALYTFLSMHPSMDHNFDSENTFEEVQFFNGRNYFNGVDWYMQHFPSRKGKMMFEKSANYFDADDAPRRAHALLPNVKLITILINPAKRAYSWYQHQRSHQDKTALEYSFYEVVAAGDDAPRHLRELRNRCLDPGMYALHLEHWLSYYTPGQLMVIDGEELRSDPVSVMDKVQLFLNSEPYIDYSYRLKFNKKKGFFCQVVNGEQSKCLGRSKGRLYPQMEVKAEKFLSTYYRKYNVALSKLLSRLGQPVPKWLAEELRES